MTKKCTKCNEDKSLDLFAYGKKYTDGRRNICKKCHSSYMTEYYKNNPEKYAVKVAKSSIGKSNWKSHHLTEEQYIDLLNLHQGKCHGCRERKAINIDHDHNCCNGRFSCGSCVRGILCSQCNSSLGLMGDSPSALMNLIDYISKISK